MRVRSDIWVAAYIRRCFVDGVYAVLRRRGADEAGAIFVKVDCLDGRASLYGPAPAGVESPPGVDRLFTKTHPSDWIPSAEADARLNRETNFDPDLWIVDVEDRRGQPRLDLVP